MLVIVYDITRWHNAEDYNSNFHHYDNLTSHTRTNFVCRKGKYLNIWFFLLCKRNEAGMWQKYIYGGMWWYRTRHRSHTHSYQLHLNHGQSQGQVRSIILRQAATLAMSTYDLLLQKYRWQVICGRQRQKTSADCIVDAIIHTQRRETALKHSGYD